MKQLVILLLLTLVGDGESCMCASIRPFCSNDYIIRVIVVSEDLTGGPIFSQFREYKVWLQETLKGSDKIAHALKGPGELTLTTARFGSLCGVVLEKWKEYWLGGLVHSQGPLSINLCDTIVEVNDGNRERSCDADEPGPVVIPPPIIGGEGAESEESDSPGPGPDSPITGGEGAESEESDSSEPVTVAPIIKGEGAESEESDSPGPEPVSPITGGEGAESEESDSPGRGPVEPIIGEEGAESEEADSP